MTRGDLVLGGHGQEVTEQPEMSVSMKNRQTRSRTILAPLLLVAIALGPNLRGQVTTAARVGDGIPLRGLAANHYGLVLWNTGPGAAEPAMTGHTTTWTPCSVSAPYYVATRDHADIDVAPNVLLRPPDVRRTLAR